VSSLELAEFQRAAVETICERLTNAGGSRRFLLADEVGLGKTVVARGVIDELLRRRRGRELVVVYLCSNTEIADQNRTKLAPNAQPSLRRITQLAWSQSRRQPQLYSFLPARRCPRAQDGLGQRCCSSWFTAFSSRISGRVSGGSISDAAPVKSWKAGTSSPSCGWVQSQARRAAAGSPRSGKADRVDGATLVLSEVLRGEVDQFKPTDAGSQARNLIVECFTAPRARFSTIYSSWSFDGPAVPGSDRGGDQPQSIAARLFEGVRRPLSATPYTCLPWT
jgi:hypothetical protein